MSAEGIPPLPPETLSAVPMSSTQGPGEWQETRGRILAFGLPDNKCSSEKTDVIRRRSGMWVHLESESETNIEGSEEGTR